MSVNQSYDNPFALQTTGNGWTPYGTFSIPADNTAVAQIQVAARKESDGASAVWNRTILVKRVGSGNVQVVGSVVDLITPQKDLAMLLTDIRFVASGGDLLLECKGLGSTDIQWVAQGEVLGYKV